MTDRRSRSTEAIEYWWGVSGTSAEAWRPKSLFSRFFMLPVFRAGAEISRHERCRDQCCIQTSIPEGEQRKYLFQKHVPDPWQGSDDCCPPSIRGLRRCCYPRLRDLAELARISPWHFSQIQKVGARLPMAPLTPRIKLARLPFLNFFSLQILVLFPYRPE